MLTRKKVLITQQEVIQGFDSNDYQAERLWVAASDDTQVPISLVYRKTLKMDGRDPLLLTGYGMYSSSQEDRFPSDDLALLERGFICATAHVRGGGELPGWWEDGNYLISGGWVDLQGDSPMKTTIAGCTWGGSAIKEDNVAACGLHLEFGIGVVTSTIQKVSVIRQKGNQLVY